MDDKKYKLSGFSNTILKTGTIITAVLLISVIILPYLHLNIWQRFSLYTFCDTIINAGLRFFCITFILCFSTDIYIKRRNDN